MSSFARPLSEFINHLSGQSDGAGNRRCPHPDHDDNHPSFSCCDRTEQFYCASHSNAVAGQKLQGKGKVSFAMQFHGCSKEKAIDIVREFEGGVKGRDDRIVAALTAADGHVTPPTPPTPPTPAKSPSYRIIDKAVAAYHRSLFGNATALRYVADRGITDESILLYQLGFAPSEWEIDTMSQRLGLEGDQIAERLSSCGLVTLTSRGPQLIFKNRLMFPIENHNGYVGFTGRDITGRLQARYKFSPRNEICVKGDCIFGGAVARKALAEIAGSRLTVVEGNVDAIRLNQAGIPAVAVMGTSISDAQMHQIFTLTDRVDFCFDGDNAGQDATLKLFKDLLPRVRDSNDIRFISLPSGCDPDEMVTRGEWVAGESLADILTRSVKAAADEDASIALMNKIGRSASLRQVMQEAIGYGDAEDDSIDYRKFGKETYT